MKVLNIGSMNLDHVYNVDHIVLPGETQATDGMNIFLGGKGMNQSIALAKAQLRQKHHRLSSSILQLNHQVHQLN